MKMKLFAVLALSVFCAGTAFAADVKAKTASQKVVETSMIDIKSLKPAKTFTILKAVYGVKGENTDITAQVQAIVKAKGKIEASNRIIGKDPAPGKAKKLEIAYSVGGKIKLVSIKEWQSIPSSNLK